MFSKIRYMKIFIPKINESWIVDRFRSEWYENNKNISTTSILKADIIWIMAPWMWKKIPKFFLKRKIVLCTYHHFVESKFSKLDFDDLDQYVNSYHAISKYTEILNIAEVYFSKNFSKYFDEKIQDDFKNIYIEFLDLIININKWEYDIINLEIKEFIKKNNIKFPVLGKPVRYLLTNNYNGPSITDIFMILGKSESIDRLKRYKI